MGTSSSMLTNATVQPSAADVVGGGTPSNRADRIRSLPTTSIPVMEAPMSGQPQSELCKISETEGSSALGKSLSSPPRYGHAAPWKDQERVKDEIHPENIIYAIIQKPDPTKKYAKWMRDKVLLIPEPGVSRAICWSAYTVAEWIVGLGYPQYRECFKTNYISGRKLIHFREIKNFPKIGITDFNHMKDISTKIDRILNVSKPSLSQYENYAGPTSVALPADGPYEQYLEDKAHNGRVMDFKSYTRYSKEYAHKYDRTVGMPDGKRKWRKPAKM